MKKHTRVSKKTCLSLLICLNLLLLTGMILASSSPAAAYAQDTGLAGNYLVVAGEIQDQFDALYVLDTRARNLYAFKYDRGRRVLELIGARDLERDFRNNRD